MKTKIDAKSNCPKIRVRDKALPDPNLVRFRNKGRGIRDAPCSASSIPSSAPRTSAKTGLWTGSSATASLAITAGPWIFILDRQNAACLCWSFP